MLPLNAVEGLWMTTFCDSLTQHRYETGYLAGQIGQRPMIHTIFEGTSEIQQLVISRAISGLRIE
jgi:alkylation response protein AidB-like acyl-CoA dehydrogenase